MKRIIPLAVAVTIAGVCCVVAGYFCQFYYFRYRDVVTGLESSINFFDMRLSRLEAHKSRELTPVHVRGMISTTDRPLDEHMLGYLSSERRPDNYFEAINAKGGPFIRPEFRVPGGSTTNCEYHIQIEDQFGVVADAWLSHAEPYQDLAAFEEFRVYCLGKTNRVTLIARLRREASVQMRFELVLLCLK